MEVHSWNRILYKYQLSSIDCISLGCSLLQFFLCLNFQSLFHTHAGITLWRTTVCDSEACIQCRMPTVLQCITIGQEEFQRNLSVKRTPCLQPVGGPYDSGISHNLGSRQHLFLYLYIYINCKHEHVCRINFVTCVTYPISLYQNIIIKLYWLRVLFQYVCHPNKAPCWSKLQLRSIFHLHYCKCYLCKVNGKVTFAKQRITSKWRPFIRYTMKLTYHSG